MVSPLEIFCCYARKDQSYLDELKIHLTPLQRQGLITIWSNFDINAGANWENEIRKHLDSAHIILLLVSPDFMASDYCYSTEMKRALERHANKEAHVIPIILRPAHWNEEPFAKLQALPKDGKPVTRWNSWDEAFLDVDEGIRIVVKGLLNNEKLAPSNINTPVSPHETPLAPDDAKPPPVLVLPPEPIKLSPPPAIQPNKSVELDLLRTLTRDSSYILTITVSPDGQMLASGNLDGTIKVWSLYRRRPLRTFQERSNVVSSVGFSPDGKILISGGNDKTVNLWDLGTGESLRTLEGHSEPIMSVAFSPDGKTCASGSDDRTIKVWDSETGKLLRTLEEHSKAVTCIAFSPDGQILASGSYDTTVKIWRKK